MGFTLAPVALRLRMHRRVAVDLAGWRAWNTLARVRLARPSMLIAPMTLVFVVWTGSRW